MMKSQEPIQRELIGPVQKKLERCRNQENNPESEMLVTVIILSFRTSEVFGHTVWAKNVDPDPGLHCLPFGVHLLYPLLCNKMVLFKF